MIRQKLGDYYQLCKPGIVYGNALVAAAGFAYGSKEHVDWLLFVYTLLGLSLIIASACVFNNYYDRGIDAKMVRTRSRPLVTGHVPGPAALWFGLLLGVFGALLLLFFTTLLAFTVALVGFAVYVLVYTPLKHTTSHALWVGAFAGATPPVVGYTAATGALDLTSLWLFLFLFVWQIPHFLGIAAYRYDEYATAEIPMLLRKPSVRGKKIGRTVFYTSLVVLLLWCGALMLQR